jgi:hypothetical protein
VYFDYDLNMLVVIVVHSGTGPYTPTSSTTTATFPLNPVITVSAQRDTITVVEEGGELTTFSQPPGMTRVMRDALFQARDQANEANFLDVIAATFEGDERPAVEHRIRLLQHP